MRKLFIILLLLLSFFYKAQDFLPFQNHQLLNFINPSFAGSNESSRIQAYSIPRDLFFGSGLSFDKYNSKKQSAFSAIYNRDGFFSRMILNHSVELNFAKYYQINDRGLKLVPSFGIGYFERKVDLSLFSSSGSPARGMFERSKTSRFNSSILISSTNFYFGLSYHSSSKRLFNFTSDLNLVPRLNIYTSYYKSLNSKSRLNIVLNYNSQSSFNQAQLMLNYLSSSPIYFGLGYTSYDISLATIGFNFKYFSASLLYARNMTRLPFSPNTIQINLSYSFSGAASPLLNFEER